MAKLIFHIGMHKAGSSAIQSSLAAASGDDFIYPQLGEPPFKHHHTDAIVKLFSSSAAKVAERYKFTGKKINTSDEDEERIRQAAAEAGDRPVILSSEGAYVHLTVQDLAGFKSYMEPLFDDIQIVGYVREPFSLISSKFQAGIKAHRLRNFAPTYKSYRLFGKFDQAFGRDKVNLLEFDRAKFPNGNVVEHFCQEVGIKPTPSMEVNQAISRPAVSAMYRLNRTIGAETDKAAVKAFIAARKAVIRRFPHAQWPSFRLSPKVIEPLVEAQSEDMAWIEERMGRSLRGAYEPREGDVTSEADLLTIDPRAVAQLSELGETLSEPAKDLMRQALAG